MGVGLLLQFVVQPMVGAFYSKVLLDIGINVMLAASLNVVNGFTGQFSIGHAGFMAVGGYSAAVLTYYGSFLLWGSADRVGGFLGAGEMLFFVSCLVGGIVAAAMGYVVGLPSLRLRGDYLAIVTLGFGEIVRVLLQQTKGVLFTAEAVQSKPVAQLPLHVGGAVGFNGLEEYTSLFWLYLFVGITLVTCFRLKQSSFGRAFLSLREDEIAASAMGVHATRYKVRAFVLSAFFAGVAGALFAHEVGNLMNPRELGFQKSFDVVIMVVMGGMGSISGVVLAAIILTVLPEALREFAQYRMIVYALLLIVMMIVRPQGLFGVHEIWDWRRLRRPPKAAT